MGFSNAIYKYPKFKDTTKDQIRNIENYYKYDTNEWAKRNFTSAQGYMEYNDGYNKESYEPITQDQLDFYKPFVHEDEYGYLTIDDYVYDNYSAGMPFHEDIKEVLNKDDSEIESLELTQKDIIKLLAFEIKKLNGYKLEPAYINHSYIQVDGDEYEPEITLKKCDGVEVTFEEGTIKRFETNSKYSDYGTLIMMPKQYIDEYEYEAQFNLVQTLASILETTDFDKECLYYSGGW